MTGHRNTERDGLIGRRYPQLTVPLFLSYKHVLIFPWRMPASLGYGGQVDNGADKTVLADDGRAENVQQTAVRTQVWTL